jgi:multiple sugar transport system permease protein
MKTQRLLMGTLNYALLAGMLVIALFPIYWILVTSLKPTAEIYRLVPTFWPETVTTTGYVNLFARTHFVSWLRNSAVVALVVAFLSIVLSVLAAYGLARFRFRGRRTVAFLILVAYLMPPALLFIPLYILVTRAGLSGSMAGLMLVYPTITIPYATWVLTSYFRSISIDMEEAALIDGCSRLGALRHVTLPLAAPGVVSTFIFAFTLCWSEYLYALVILSGSQQTMPLGLSSLIVADVPRWNEIMAGAIIASVPVTLMYIIASRYIVSGLTLGGSKG